MYVQKGCQHCDGAKQFFEAQNVSVESIEIGFDPILLNAFRNPQTGQPYPVPVIISYATQEVVLGNDPVQLQRLVAALVSSTSAPNTAS